MLVPCWFTVFVFWPGHSTTKSQACFGMCLFCFEVVNQRENYKRQTFYCEMLSSRMGCSRLLTFCSRFAHVLLTLCSGFAHALGDDVSILMKKTHKQTMPHFFVPSHVYLRHTAFRLQTPWGWFSNQKNYFASSDPHHDISKQLVDTTFVWSFCHGTFAQLTIPIICFTWQVIVHVSLSNRI